LLPDASIKKDARDLCSRITPAPRGFGQGPYGMSYLAIEVSQTDPKNMEVSMLFEVVIRFWRDFLQQYGSFNQLPKGKTKLSDE
jgi:hypothetical protein